MLSKKYRMDGFTLLEILLVIFFISIFSTMAIPTLHYWYFENHKKVVAHDMISRLNLVRSEAIRRGATVSLCKKDEWWQGQIVLDEALNIIYQFPALPKQEFLFWRSSLAKDNCITFDSLGFTLGQKGSFYYAWRQEQPHKILTLQECGRIRVSNLF